MRVNTHWRNVDAYRLAVEHGRYRAACREAIAALRRSSDDPAWIWRLRGAFARRAREVL